MSLRLIEIPDLKDEWQTHHKIRALEINGRCEVLLVVEKRKQEAASDYKKILNAMAFVGRRKRGHNPNHVKKSETYPRIYEMLGKKCHARVLFFYSKGVDEIVVCTNTYWKTKTSRREQNRAFERANRLRNLYGDQVEA